MSDPIDYSSMPAPRAERLTKEEAADYRRRLSQWGDFRTVDGIMKEIANKTHFYAVSQRAAQFWREMFVGLSCLYLTHADAVRLGDDPPDIVLRYGERETPLEIVDALPESRRRRGDEFNALAEAWNTNASEMPVKTFDADAEYHAMADDVAAAISAKITKAAHPSRPYADRTVLVVDIHHAMFNRSGEDVERAMLRSARPALQHFAEVWLRRGDELLRISPEAITRISHPWPRGE